MSSANFCGLNIVACVFESIIGLTTFSVVLVLGCKAVSIAKSKSGYVQDSYTPRHLIKLGLLLLLELLCIVYLVVYTIMTKKAGQPIEILSEFIWVLNALCWFFCMYLLRVEFKTYGYTSIELRLIWFCELVGHFILFGFNLFASEGNTNQIEFKELRPIWFGYLAVVMFLVFTGFGLAEDYPVVQRPNNYTFMANDKHFIVQEQSLQRIVTDVNKTGDSLKLGDSAINISEGLDQPLLQKPKKGSSRVEIREPSAIEKASYLTKSSIIDNNKSSIKSEEYKKSTISNPTVKGADYLKEHISRMSRPSIIGWEEIYRFDKKTIVFIIEFYIGKDKFTAKRSYTEFSAFMKECAKEFPNIKFPDIPPKRQIKGDEDDEDVFRERVAVFETFLAVCQTTELFTPNFVRFLSSTKDLPFYGKIEKKDSSKLSAPFSSVLGGSPLLPTEYSSILFNTSLDGDYEYTFNLDNVDNKRTIIARPSQIGSKVSAVEKPSALLTSEHNNPSLTSNMSSVGPDLDLSYHSYHSVHEDDGMMYKVETLGTITKGKDETYYEFLIMDVVNKKETTIYKRYSELKALDKQLKEYYKKDKIDLPSLPFKGNLSFMLSKTDPRVIEYRRVALRSYLQGLLNDERINQNPHLWEFINTVSINMEVEEP